LQLEKTGQSLRQQGPHDNLDIKRQLKAKAITLLYMGSHRCFIERRLAGQCKTAPRLPAEKSMTCSSAVVTDSHTGRGLLLYQNRHAQSQSAAQLRP
jgi:hypothetical protein